MMVIIKPVSRLPCARYALLGIIIAATTTAAAPGAPPTAYVCTRDMHLNTAATWYIRQQSTKQCATTTEHVFHVRMGPGNVLLIGFFTELRTEAPT